MSSISIENPILKGFNPDPSIIKVNNDYYIATSTFEWFPGVQVFHSRDKVNWNLITRPLNRISQLDMKGVPDSCGVWAPCLSYDNGTFYLTYSIAKRYWSHCKDVHNYVVTTDDITADWSEPTFLNSSGFDPSLFHDNNGKKWLVNLCWDHRQRGVGGQVDANAYFNSIVLQEFDVKQQKLIGKIEKIYTGSSLGKAEGPHLYQRDGYYYLLVAEGGTGYQHATRLLRAKTINGAYTPDPNGVFLTSSETNSALQRAGHADIIDIESSHPYVVHLCSRPLANQRSVMGRETALQQAYWTDDGWLRLLSNKTEPATQLTLNADSEITLNGKTQEYYHFDEQQLPAVFQSLRIPLSDNMLSLSERPGFLRLKGHESVGSCFEQALVARRQQAFAYSAATAIDFKPNNFQQMAGLICYYNSNKYYYLHVTHHETLGRVLEITSCSGDSAAQYFTHQPIPLPETTTIHLNAEVNHGTLQFYWGTSGDNWQAIGPELDYSVLSDEVGAGGVDANFTGTFIGLCCQDLSGTHLAADFDYFIYVEH